MRLALPPLLAVALGLLPVACGGAGAATVQCRSSDVRVELSEYRYSPSHLTVPAGRTTFCLVNTGSMEHDMVIGNAAGSQAQAESTTIQPGQRTRFPVTLTAGVHQFWCSIPGHREAGMVGKLTVT